MKVISHFIKTIVIIFNRMTVEPIFDANSRNRIEFSIPTLGINSNIDSIFDIFNFFRLESS